MARTPEAKIAPALLVWAREDLGLDRASAARKVGVAEERLAAWETGEARPSIAQLRKAASVYKRPLAVFYLPEPPRGFQALRDFRRVAEGATAVGSPQLRLAIRRAHSQRVTWVQLRSLLEEPQAATPRIDVAHDDPERFGGAARQLLGVSLASQQQWGDGRRALRAWIAALEDLDVLVLHAQRIEVSEMRGFSISDHAAPVIVLNGADGVRARIFTLLHEFAHILLNNTGVCDLHDSRAGDPAGDVEVFCNRAAAAMLLPADALRSEPLVAGHRGATWGEAELRALADRYSVSREVLVRRLFSLGLTSWEFMQQKVREYAAAYRSQKQREAESSGGPSWYRVHVRDLGRDYIRTVLDAYGRSEITSSEVSDFLEVKLNNLAKLEDEFAHVAAA